MQISRRITGLIVAAMLAVPAAAPAQTPQPSPSDEPGSSQPPIDLGGDEGSPDDSGSKSSELPNTGSDPRMLILAGAALTLLGVGLRLRTADADLY